jgi:hypothetical protein
MLPRAYLGTTIYAYLVVIYLFTYNIKTYKPTYIHTRNKLG